LEKPSQQKSINLITPAYSFVTVNASQSFTWGTVVAAVFYQLKIDSCDFTTAGYQIADTALKATVCVRIFWKYRWYVQAVNFSFFTIYGDTNALTAH